MQQTHRLPYLAQCGIVILLYLAGIEYAIQFNQGPSSVIPVWPAAGVGYGAFLLFRYRIWPAIIVAMILNYLFIESVTWIFAAPIIVLSAVTPAFGLWIVETYLPVNYHQIRVKYGFYLLLAGFLQSVFSGTVGSFLMCISGRAEWSEYLNLLAPWALGNTFGIIAVTPAMLMIGTVLQSARRSTRPSHPIVYFAGVLEKIIWGIGIVVMIGLIFINHSPPLYQLMLVFLPMALLLWSALRMPPAYTVLTVCGMTLLLIWRLGLDVVGFPPPDNLWETVVLLLFFSVFSIAPQVIAGSSFERQAYARKLAFRADHDALTGLLNRTSFEERVERISLDAAATMEPLALCYVDLDQFKVVNDTCGHSVGDYVLQQVATVLSQNLRDGDLVARLGGDEFGVLMRNCTPEQAEQGATRLLHALQEHRFMWRRRIFALTASIGVVAVDFSEHVFADILSEADAACYTAKENGRDRVILSCPDERRVRRNREHMAWAVQINEALEQNRFRLYCQPIASANDPNPGLLHFEILLRLIDREGELRTPGAFLPAAERFDLMTRVDRWVVDNILTYLDDRNYLYDRISLCSINLSGASLGDEHFHQFLIKRLAMYPRWARKLCFEITETAAIGDLAHASSLIDSLKKVGCCFALDDFGSGLASFSYLKSLQVDYLKIDGAFVRDMVNAPVDHAMVRSINEVGHLMGKKTIAEYVENSDINDALREVGVDFVQGYAIGRPMPIDAFFQPDPAVHAHAG